MFVTFSNTDIVVSPADIEFGEEASMFGFVNEFLDERQRVLILDRSFI